MSKVKICGITTLEEVSYLNETLPDYAGFVFAPSKRRVSVEMARQMKDKMSNRIQTVGVFVQNSIEEISQLCETGVIDLIQLHGNESKEYVEDLKQQLSRRIPIIYAIGIENERDYEKQEFMDADYYLYDTKCNGMVGGSGKCFHWQRLRTVEKPFFLAGGLNEKNVREAIRIMNPSVVDVSSGVETNGKKDLCKIKKFVKIVRNLSL